MGEDEKIIQAIAALEDEHKLLDAKIDSEHGIDMIYLQRLKKRKLWLKDEIARLHSILQPDIIA